MERKGKIDLTVWLDNAVIGLKQRHVVGDVRLDRKGGREGGGIHAAACEVVGRTGEDGCDTGCGHGRHDDQRVTNIKHRVGVSCGCFCGRGRGGCGFIGICFVCFGGLGSQARSRSR